MAEKITQEEIDKAVAAAQKAAEDFGKSTLFAGPGQKPAPVEGLKPAGTPEQVDTDYSAARKAMAKAANGEALDDMDKAALKAFDKKMDDDKKDDAEKAQKAFVKSVGDAVAAALAAKAAVTPAAVAPVAQSPDMAAFMKSMQERDAKQGELVAELAKGLTLAAAQAKAATEAVASFAKGGNPGPKSGGAGNLGDVNPDLARRVAQSEFEPRAIEKGTILKRIREQLEKGNPEFVRADLGNFNLHGLLRDEVRVALKTAYGA